MSEVGKPVTRRSLFEDCISDSIHRFNHKSILWVISVQLKPRIDSSDILDSVMIEILRWTVKAFQNNVGNIEHELWLTLFLCHKDKPWLRSGTLK